MPDEYLPPQVRSLLDGLLEHTKVPATLTRSGSTYQVDHGNDRVHLMCRYVRNSRGRFTYTSVLTVDGESRDWVSNEAAYARLLADPDEAHPNRRPGYELPPVHPLADDDEVPGLVTAMAEMIGKQPNATELRVGHTGMAQRKRWAAWTWKPLNEDDQIPDPTGYVIEVYNAVKGERVQLHFLVHDKLGHHYLSGVSGVDDQGRDLMAEYGEDINKAIEGLLGVKVPQKANVDSGPAKVQGDSKGAVSNSVRVVKSTVFRI